ncbi:MAG TPA: propanediol utilization microcompartment protein PduB [Desulfosporosinus sp.]|nr:propanediol utilization microcompartment protein PduB [Desulfosporosinus sp.]
MDNEKIVQQVMAELLKQNTKTAACVSSVISSNSFTEFVGVGPGDTIGLVLASVDPVLSKALEIDPKYRSIGLIGSRTGAGPQATAADDAVKASNSEVIRLELPRDTKGGPGHGIMIIFGAEEVSDARRAVETTLANLERQMGGVYVSEAGHLETQYSARASSVLSTYLGGKEGKAWGMVGAAPSVIGILAADALLKAADVEVTMAMSPTKGTSFSNEYIICYTGDSGAVKQATIVGRDVAYKALAAMGSKPVCVTKPYLEPFIED